MMKTSEIRLRDFPHPYMFLREPRRLLQHPTLSLVSILKLFMQWSNSAESFDLESVFRVHLLTHIKHTIAISTSCRTEALISCPRYSLEIWNRIAQVGRDLRRSASPSDENIRLIPPSSREDSNQPAFFPSFSLPLSPFPSVLPSVLLP